MQIKSTCARPNIKNPGRRKNYSNACGEDEDCVLKLYDPLKEWARYPGDSNASTPWLAGRWRFSQNAIQGSAGTPAPPPKFHHFPVRVTESSGISKSSSSSRSLQRQKQLWGRGGERERESLKQLHA